MQYSIPSIYPTILDTGGHTLIAGTTGSGKSVFLQGLITTALIKGDIHLCLIDPKRVELCEYRSLSACKGYAETLEQAEQLLQALCDLMENRYITMQKQGLKQTISDRILIIIDELADLLISDSGQAIKKYIQRLAQLGRAANITLIVATQAPNRKIIPAEIVLNFTQRIGLRCLTGIESRQVVNVKGCETLPMWGECLYLRPAHNIELWSCPMLAESISQSVLASWQKISTNQVIRLI